MPPSRPFFTVILPTYNRIHAVCVAIESLMAQTYCDFELLVVDDGSTDGTVAYLQRRYRVKIKAGQIRVIKIPHGGSCAARNAALSEARGEWIAYLDSDNIVSSDFLQTFADGIVNHPGAKNFYAALVGRHSGAILDEPFSLTVLFRWNYIDMGTYCHHRNLIGEFGGFDSEVTGLEDWDIILRHSSKYEPIRLGRVVLNYCDAKDDSRLTYSAQSPEKRRIIQRKFIRADAGPIDRERVKLVEGSPFFDDAWYSSTYADLVGDMAAAEHYLTVGWQLGCDPGPFFSTCGYLKRNLDVARANVNPLVHYERNGRSEGRLGFLSTRFS